MFRLEDLLIAYYRFEKKLPNANISFLSFSLWLMYSTAILKAGRLISHITFISVVQQWMTNLFFLYIYIDAECFFKLCTCIFVLMWSLGIRIGNSGHGPVTVGCYDTWVASICHILVHHMGEE